ncbi:MAG: CHAT domain-containing protein [Chloroflexi bacterium]|nr:MAG: CHAT domain-containing protein [Chloroflexota bacterium]
MAHDYLDFELSVEAAPNGSFVVTVLRSPAGETKETVAFPYSERALENRLKDLKIALLSSGGGFRRSVLTEEEASVKELGSAFFDFLLAGEVRSLFNESQREAERGGRGLRLKLRVDVPELAALPWEFLHDPRNNDYLSLASDTPLIRYLPVAQSIRPLTVTPPLRILGMVASPRGYDPLNVALEQERMKRALADLQARGLMELTWLEGGSWRALQREMRRSDWHIFHFIGHGGFDKEKDEGFLAFADEAGEAERIHASQLARLLGKQSLRLALLNACEGARGGQYDVFSSTAATLAQRSLPAVVAMQYAISDRAAVEFARSFYEALADGLPVDAAVTEARVAMSTAPPNSVEWGTPVLYMRATDGRIFDMQTATPPATPPAAVTAPAAQPQVATPPVVSPTVEQPDTERSTIPLLPPAREKGEPASASSILAGASVAWRKIVGPSGNTLNDLRRVKIIRGISLGAFLILALFFYLIFRNSTEQETPAALLPPTISFFRVEPAVVVRGKVESAQLSWSITGDVTSVAITGPGIDQSLIFSQTGGLRVTLEQSSAFVLTARNHDQTVTQQVVIGVIAPMPEPKSAPAAGATQEIEDITFVYVPAGEFTMGSPLELSGSANDHPEHKVILDGYWIGKTEVTNAQYASCVKEKACDPPTNSRWNDGTFANHPVVNVSWENAVAYTRWFTEKRGIPARLPSEAEWEKACRGDDLRLYPWEGDAKPSAELLNFRESGIDDTTAVGSYPVVVSPYGALDMAGNVAEWTADWYDRGYYGQAQDSNPTGPDSGDNRVLRGGSFYGDRDVVRCFIRDNDKPVNGNRHNGFRLLIERSTVPPTPTPAPTLTPP